jgi:superfamily II DNA or RNA helicase
MSKKDILHKIEEKKKLYSYQLGDIDLIFDKIENAPHNYHLLYQLPTGGGKTVIFSEITRRYLEKFDKKVVVLTHRIELCKQTSKMLKGFDVKNKIINSIVKELPDQDEYSCFVAMVETLKNRLNDEKLHIDNVGLLIIDEAHFNSFRKLFHAFKNTFFLGVTATPLSSNIKLPMNENYHELIVGNSIGSLIDKGYLAKATTYSYDVGLTSLKIGINGDYTVKSSDELYTNMAMQEKLIHAYTVHSFGKKTLIFNNGIMTSLGVLDVFKEAGFKNIKHLDNTNSNEERKDILKWFKETPNAILTSVGILTTGFDEPTVESIILNRATKSLTLYFQMIGRGSRKLPNKDNFTIIDLGNNAARFGLWTDKLDWQHIFKYPEQYIHNLKGDLEIEMNFFYKMPPELRAKFSNTESIDFDIESEYRIALANNLRPKVVIEKSINHHATMCVDNSETLLEAKQLAKELADDIESRVRHFTNCLSSSTKNYRDWLIEDYKIRLSVAIGKKFREKLFSED